VSHNKPFAKPVIVKDPGQFDGDCDHIKMHDSAWIRTPPSRDPQPVPPAAGGGGITWPNATWAALTIAPGATVTIKLALGVCLSAASAESTVAAFAKDEPTFDGAWAAAHDRCLPPTLSYIPRHGTVL